MRRTIKIVIPALFLVLSTATGVRCAEWGVGVGVSTVSLKYISNPRDAYEVRVSSRSGISAHSGRYYRNISLGKGGGAYAGVEGGWVRIDQDDIGGSGSFALLFAGFERGVGERFAFSLDIGPAYIALSSGNASAHGIEWIVNLGIYYYFPQGPDHSPSDGGGA